MEDLFDRDFLAAFRVFWMNTSAAPAGIPRARASILSSFVRVLVSKVTDDFDGFDDFGGFDGFIDFAVVIVKKSQK